MIEKKLFNESISFHETSALETYQHDISQMFRWMQNIELRTEPVFLDVGANVGLFSLAFAYMFQQSTIHSFEPINFIYQHLIENLKLNKLVSDRIHAHNVGMSNRVESRLLSIPTADQHERYSKPTDIRHYSAYGKGEEKFQVQFTTIDQWFGENNLSAIDFIKVDVEGHEYPVLQGAECTIEKFRPIIMFELNYLTLSLSKIKAAQYLSFASRLDYSIFGFQYGYKTELLPITSENQLELISDIILIPPRH